MTKSGIAKAKIKYIAAQFVDGKKKPRARDSAISLPLAATAASLNLRPTFLTITAHDTSYSLLSLKGP